MDFVSLQTMEAAVMLSVNWIGLASMSMPRHIGGVVFPAGALVSLALAATSSCRRDLIAT